MEVSELKGRTRYGYYNLTPSHELYSYWNRWQVWRGYWEREKGRTSVSNTDRAKNYFFNRLILKYDLQSYPPPSPPTSPQNQRLEIGAWLLRGFFLVLGE